MTSHRALWAGRIMSAFVVVALVADGTIQLFAPAQIASMLQETGRGSDHSRLRHPLRHPGHRRPRRDPKADSDHIET